MNIITTLAASVLMSPANVASDVPAIQQDFPTYDWKSQKVMRSEKQERLVPKTGVSVMGTRSYVGSVYTIDDWNTWD